MKIAKKIQLVVDKSENNDKATDQAMKMAKNLDSELSSLYVVNTHMHKTPNVIEAMVRTGRKHLKALKDMAINMGISITTSKVLVLIVVVVPLTVKSPVTITLSLNVALSDTSKESPVFPPVLLR